MQPSDRATLVLAAALGAVSGQAARRLLWPSQALPEPVPVAAEDYFSAEEIAAGKRYAGPQRLIGTAGSVLDLAVLVALVRRQHRRSARPTSSHGPDRSALTRAVGAGLCGAGISAGLTVVGLPLDAVARRRSLAIGLSTESWRDWATDLVKATAIESALNGALLAGSSALASRWPRRWWIPASAGLVGTAVLAGLLAPVLTEPLFNDFEPLPEGSTRRDVLELAQRAGVDVGEVFSVDASRRTTAVNAYVNGLGPTKRVVLFDTLLTGYGADEVRFVVAHELGHVRHRDVWRLIGYLALTAPPAMLATQSLTRIAADRLDGPDAVPVLMLSALVAMAPVGLGGAALSRAVERRTDDFGLRLTGAPEALISFFVKIAAQNHADVRPEGPLRRRLATHPPITERIGAALAFQRAAH